MLSLVTFPSPLSTPGSEGNFFSHCGKIRVLFYKVTKTAFQPYCVSSSLLYLSDQVSLWSLYLPQLTLRLLVLRKHDPFTDILLVLISQWPFLFFLLSIFKLFLSSRKRMMVMAKVIFGKWNCWVIFIDIFFKKSLTSHCSLRVGSALYLWLISPCPHFSSRFFFSLASLHGMWVLSSQLEIEPTPLPLKVWHPNYWIAREVPQLSFFIKWNCLLLCPPCLYASVSSLYKTCLPSFFTNANLPFWNDF